MRVPSRAFIEPYFPSTGSATGIANYSLLPPQPATALQQSRWAKLVSPSDTRNVVKFAFYPYTLRWSGCFIGTAGMSTTSTNRFYTEYQSGKRWMSMAFLGNTGTTPEDDVRFYGPYLMPYGQDGLPTHAPESDPNPGTVTWARNVQLTVWVQFRGQK